MILVSAGFLAVSLVVAGLVIGDKAPRTLIRLNITAAIVLFIHAGYLEAIDSPIYFVPLLGAMFLTVFTSWLHRRDL